MIHQTDFEKLLARLNSKGIENPISMSYPAPNQEMATDFINSLNFEPTLFFKNICNDFFGIDIIWEETEKIKSTNTFMLMMSNMQSSTLTIINGVPESLFSNGYFPLANRGFGVSVVFKIVNQQIILFLILQDSSIHELDISFEEYINLMVQTGGIDLTEIYLTKVFPESLKKCHYDNFKERLQTNFPEIDLKLFKQLNTINSLPNYYNTFTNYNFANKFKTAYNSINENYTIKLNPAYIQEIRRVELQSGYCLPEEFIAFYLCVGSIGVGYIAPNYEERLSIGFRILPLQEMFGGKIGSSTNPDYWNKDVKQYWELPEDKHLDLKGIHPFYISEYGIIGLKFNNGISVFYISNDYEAKKLDLSFNDLINELLNTRGFGRWQYHLAFHSTNENYANMLLKAFPDANIELYK